MSGKCVDCLIYLNWNVNFLFSGNLIFKKLEWIFLSVKKKKIKKYEFLLNYFRICLTKGFLEKKSKQNKSMEKKANQNLLFKYLPSSWHTDTWPRWPLSGSVVIVHADTRRCWWLHWWTTWSAAIAATVAAWKEYVAVCIWMWTWWARWRTVENTWWSYKSKTKWKEKKKPIQFSIKRRIKT